MTLTQMFDVDFERQYRNTKPGQAHLAGSGPPGKRCRDCSHFLGEGEKPGACAVTARILIAQKSRRKPEKFRGAAAACKHFQAKR